MVRLILGEGRDGLALEERIAEDDAGDQRGKMVVSLARPLDDPPDRAAVLRAEAAAERVGHQLFREAIEELVAVFQHRFQLLGIGEFLAIGELSARVDRELPVLVAPGADRVKILEREAERVHPLVAAGALDVLAVFAKTIAQRRRLVDRLLLRERWHIRRRRGWRRAEDLL